MARSRSRLALLFGLSAMFIVQGTQAAPPSPPPFDQLTLRDALLARPEIIASLPSEARQKLAQRFEEARRSPTEPLRAAIQSAPMAVEKMRTLDEARFSARADAFIAGKIYSAPNGTESTPFQDDVSEPAEPPPPIEWLLTAATAEAEQSALSGRAGMIVRQLLLISESSRLIRVESWPIGVVAIDGAVYVNAAWLVAMSPHVERKTPEPTKTPPQEPTEPGCGGGVSITPPSQALPPGQKGVALPEERSPQEKAVADSPKPKETQDVQSGSSGELPELQKLFGDDGSAAPRPPRSTTRASSDERISDGVHAESLPPDQTYSYAGAVGLVNPADCCRDPNACGGADSSCSANASVCADPNSSCNSSSCSNNSCSTGSCNNSGCNSGCSDDDSCKKSDGSSGCGSSSGSGCSSGSGSGCSSSSGSGCSSGSSSSCGGGSSSSCGGSSGGSSCGSGSSSSCNLGKCAMTAPRAVIRRRGDIPDVATFGILLLPLYYLIRQGRQQRRRPQA